MLVPIQSNRHNSACFVSNSFIQHRLDSALSQTSLINILQHWFSKYDFKQDQQFQHQLGTSLEMKTVWSHLRIMSVAINNSCFKNLSRWFWYTILKFEDHCPRESFILINTIVKLWYSQEKNSQVVNPLWSYF